MSVGLWSFPFALNEMVCGVDVVAAIEEAVLEILISREVNA